MKKVSDCCKDTILENTDLCSLCKEHCKEELIFTDKLDELEYCILQVYLKNGYIVKIGDWGFRVDINTGYKDKYLIVKGSPLKNDGVFHTKIFHEDNTEDMFSKAIKYYKGYLKDSDNTEEHY